MFGLFFGSNIGLILIMKHGLDGIYETFRRNRFCNMRIRASRQRIFDMAGHGVCAEHQNRRPREVMFCLK